METKEPTSFGDGNVVVHELDGIQELIIVMKSYSDEMSQEDSAGPPKMSPNERSKSISIECPFWEGTFIQAQRRRGDGRKPESSSPKAVVSMVAGSFGGRGLAGPGGRLFSSNCDADNFARLWGAY